MAPKTPPGNVQSDMVGSNLRGSPPRYHVRLQGASCTQHDGVCFTCIASFLLSWSLDAPTVGCSSLRSVYGQSVPRPSRLSHKTPMLIICVTSDIPSRFRVRGLVLPSYCIGVTVLVRTPKSRPCPPYTQASPRLTPEAGILFQRTRNLFLRPFPL